jgi:hypothetical protein
MALDLQFLQEMSNVKGDMKSLTKSVDNSIASNNSIKSSLVNLHKQIAKQSSTKEILSDIKKSDINTSDTMVSKLDDIRSLLQSQQNMFKKYFSGLRRDKSMEIEKDKSIAEYIYNNQKAASSSKEKKEKQTDGPSFADVIKTIAMGFAPQVISGLATGGLINNLFRGGSRLINSGRNFLSGRRERALENLNRKRANLDDAKKRQASSRQSQAKAQRQFDRLNKNDPNSKLTRRTKDVLDKRTKDLDKAVRNTNRAASKLPSRQAADAIEKAAKIKPPKPPKPPSSIGRVAGGVGKGLGATARGLSKVLGPLGTIASVGFEAYDTYNLLTMSEAERKAELQKVADDLSEKGPLGRAWYALNNQSKTIAATMQEISEVGDTYSTYQDAKRIDEQNEKLKERLEIQKNLNKEALTEEVIQKKLSDIGKLNNIDFSKYESKGALNQFLTSAEGRKYIEQRSLKEGTSKLQARREILEDYEFADPGTSGSAEKKQEQALPTVTFNNAVNRNTKAFESLAEELRNFIQQQQPVVMNNNTSVTSPSMDYGERQRISVAG